MERKNIFKIFAQDFQKAKNSKLLKITFVSLLALVFIVACSSLFVNISYHKTMTFIEKMLRIRVDVTNVCIMLFVPVLIFVTASNESVVESPINTVLSKLILAVAYVILMYLFYIIINLLLHLVFVNGAIGGDVPSQISGVTIEKSIGFACSNCLVLCMLSIVVASVCIMLKNIFVSYAIILPYGLFLADFLYRRVYINWAEWLYEFTLLGNLANFHNYYGDTIKMLTAIGICVLYAVLFTIFSVLVIKKRAKRIIIAS